VAKDLKSNVVAIPTKLASEEAATGAAPKTRNADAKWGREVMERGFVTVPAILIRGQRRLGLSSTQLVILLQLMDWWTDPERQPWSSKETLSQRMKISERQLQRQIAELEKAGFVKREEKITNRGKRPNTYNLSGLVHKLKELAPDFKLAKASLKQVEKPGGLKVKNKSK
jgi:predicted transcriptional regulator